MEMDSNWSTYQTNGRNESKTRALRINDSGTTSGEFAKLAHSVSTNIQKISQNTNTTQSLVSQIGTAQDTEQLRRKLHETQHYTLTLSHDTNDLLKQLNNLPAPSNHDDQRQQKLQREKLTNDFTSVLNNFQSVQRSAKDKEKASIIRAKAETGGPGDYQDEKTEQAGFTPQQRMQIQQHVDVQMLQEREQAVRQLESDIVDVNSIFKDLALMVHEQGEMIDSIEAHVDSAHISVEQGSSQIQKAAQYQAKARRKKTIMILVATVVILVLVLFLYFIFS